MAHSLKTNRNVGFKEETSAIETAVKADWESKSWPSVPQPNCAIAKLCHSQTVPFFWWVRLAQKSWQNISYSTVLWSPTKTIGKWKCFIASPERVQFFVTLNILQTCTKLLEEQYKTVNECLGVWQRWQLGMNRGSVQQLSNPCWHSSSNEMDVSQDSKSKWLPREVKIELTFSLKHAFINSLSLMFNPQKKYICKMR